jgi:hypothetical protein
MTVHVVVALCDNASQGIVPVPASLGDGDDPARNLYWGALYGVSGYFRRSAQWRSLPVAASKDARVLERALFRREILREGRRGEVLVLAEAWRGSHIADAIQQFLEMSRGGQPAVLRVENRDLEFGGAAHVVAFVGHNGLMDFAAPSLPRSSPPPHAGASIVLACLSHSYFSPLLEGHSVPLLMTTGLMAPEAYTLDAALVAWFSGQEPQAMRRAAAAAYARFQKTSERAALRLFVAPASPPSEVALD